jgi:hypothetical protein
MIGSGVKTEKKGMGVKLPQPTESQDELKKHMKACHVKTTNQQTGCLKK